MKRLYRTLVLTLLLMIAMTEVERRDAVIVGWAKVAAGQAQVLLQLAESYLDSLETGEANVSGAVQPDRMTTDTDVPFADITNSNKES